MDAMKKKKLISNVLADNSLFLRRLGDVFELAEREDYPEHLAKIFYIYKGLISLSECRLVEILLNDEFYQKTFGALEYDPEIKISEEGSRPKHR